MASNGDAAMPAAAAPMAIASRREVDILIAAGVRDGALCAKPLRDDGSV